MSAGKLAGQVLLWTIAQLIILAALIFVPAWTIHYWRAWAFLIVWAICVCAMGVYVGVKDPALMERRRKAGPTREQTPSPTRDRLA